MLGILDEETLDEIARISREFLEEIMDAVAEDPTREAFEEIIRRASISVGLPRTCLS